jgi:arginyl-tRNA synthetase
LPDERLGVPAVEKPRTFVVDYSAPNVAKPMHVGHIRSTVIGDALCRTLKFLGHKAISDNHIGDWGTQFGMILYGYKHFLDAEAYKTNPVEELARLYKKVRQSIDQKDGESETINAAVLDETAKLHAGDAENRRLWEEFLPACEDEINRVYGRLNVTFDHTLGESFYEDRLAAVVEELLAKGLARESDGAICVFFQDAKGEEEKVPMIVRKKDGAFLYATTDLATIRYRVETWKPDAILYVVDHRQGMHFKHLFTAARMLGYENLELEHVSFGTVLGDDNKPFKTRSGDTVGLESLLDEAVRRTVPSFRPSKGRKSRRSSASARLNTPTFRRTAPAITSSATTRCSR